MSKKLTIGGKQKSVPAYYHGQPTQGTPDHYVTSEEASILKSRGKATSVNRGKAILILGPRRVTDSTRNSTKRAWKVVGQTQKNALKPGFPRWCSV